MSQGNELLGYKVRATDHGSRHPISTNLHEQGFDSAQIEIKLAHMNKNSIRGTYNHAQYLQHREKMLHWHSDYMYSKLS